MLSEISGDPESGPGLSRISQSCEIPGLNLEISSAADVVLDPDTAHPELFLSGDQRPEKGPFQAGVPDNPEIRLSALCPGPGELLPWETFLGGGCRNVMVWAVGVCRDNVERKGRPSWFTRMASGPWRCLRTNTVPSPPRRFSPERAYSPGGCLPGL